MSLASRSVRCLPVLTAAAVGSAALVTPAAVAAPHHHQAHHVSAVRHAARSTTSRSLAHRFVAAINAARRRHGLTPVVNSVTLTHVADHHSWVMANDRSLFHNLALPHRVWNWTDLGENVGEGPAETDVHRAFMHSAPHRANILEPAYRQVGIGVVVDRHGRVWVTEDFRRPEPGTGAARRTRCEERALHRHHG
jgi:uncharacterized protein YkwD